MKPLAVEFCTVLYCPVTAKPTRHADVGRKRDSESVAPAVLWVDEIEKGLSGSGASGTTDGGVTARVMGSLLTWLQKQAPTQQALDPLIQQGMRAGNNGFDSLQAALATLRSSSSQVLSPNASSSPAAPKTVRSWASGTASIPSRASSSTPRAS